MHALLRAIAMTDVPRPHAICRSCFDRAVAGIASATATEIVGYCEHKQTGAVYWPTLGRWLLYSPISFEQFTAKITTPHGAIARPLGKRSMSV
jgi:hypothetical protein